MHTGEKSYCKPTATCLVFNDDVCAYAYSGCIHSCTQEGRTYSDEQVMAEECTVFTDTSDFILPVPSN